MVGDLSRLRAFRACGCRMAGLLELGRRLTYGRAIGVGVSVLMSLCTTVLYTVACPREPECTDEWRASRMRLRDKHNRSVRKRRGLALGVSRLKFGTELRRAP